MTDAFDAPPVHDAMPTLALGDAEALADVICQQAAKLTAAEHRWLLQVAEFDRGDGARWWGRTDTAAWLGWQVGLDRRTARDKVRVARALARFPVISDAMAQGHLSYAKVRAITRIATPESEHVLVDLARASTSNQLERIVAAHRRSEPEAIERAHLQHERRGLHHEVAPDASVVITVRLPPEAGFAVLAAIEHLVVRDPSVPVSVRRADALVDLVEVASTPASRRGEPARHLLTVHVDHDAIHGGAGRCEVDAAVPSAAEQPVGIAVATARRIACDCDVEVMHHDAIGNPTHLTSRSAVIRPRLRRALLVRDRGCRFPGCTRRGWVDAHHIVHRVDGGPTEPHNLVLLCRHHHRAMHEGGWSVQHHGGGRFRFTAPHGRSVPEVAPPRRGWVEEVDRHRRSADDGRCRWAGEPLDLDVAVAALRPGSWEPASGRPSRPDRLEEAS